MIGRSRCIISVTAGLMMAVLVAACGTDASKTPVSSTIPQVFYAHSVAVKSGDVYAWGVNSFGQLGTGNLDSSNVPLKVPGLPADMTDASAGGTHTLAFKSGGGVFAWGNNGFGQVGNGSSTATASPVSVVQNGTSTPLTNITAVSAGGSHSLALDGPTGAVWAWGDNISGQLGDGSLSSRNGAVQVQDPAGGTPLTGVTMIAAGSEFSLALKGGTVWAWGSNTKGQLGHNTTAANSTIPVQVVKESDVPLDNVIAIAAGAAHGLALVSDGTVWAWGLNSAGQLGNGEAGTTATPDSANKSYAVKVLLSVSGLTPAVSGNPPLAAGLDHSLVIDANGHVWGWGLNFSGQLGNGESRSTAGVSTPVQVQQSGTFPSIVTKVVAVGNHSLGFAGEKAWAWGENTFGQLGYGTDSNGATSDSAVPVAVTGFQ